MRFIRRVFCAEVAIIVFEWLFSATFLFAHKSNISNAGLYYYLRERGNDFFSSCITIQRKIEIMHIIFLPDRPLIGVLVIGFLSLWTK